MLIEILDQIDEVNKKDPHLEEWEGKKYPKELLYGQRMSLMLNLYLPSASEELQIAARGQHIRRWHIPRSDFDMNRKGYLKWRTMLKIHHGDELKNIMEKNGYREQSVNKVVQLINKSKLKTDQDSKILEDVVCLVFLKYHFADFSQKHDEEKLMSIVRKTWAKMTPKGHEMALQLPFGEEELSIIQKALNA
ncbi:MAG: DUF4202 domain-containing protein [Reichenbachiella sp.]